MMSRSYSFLVVTLSIFGTALCMPDLREEQQLDQNETVIDAEVRKLLSLDLEDGFLAGGDTPVWIAELPYFEETPVYAKMEKGIVKKAINCWISGNLDTGIESCDQPSRVSAVERKVLLFDSSPLNTTEESAKIQAAAEKVQSLTNSNSIVFHPSILITTDYDEIAAANQIWDEDKVILRRIIYVLSFWIAVDLQLRHINDPKVRLRIGGIIIDRTKKATPYLRQNERFSVLDIHEASKSMSEYWRREAKENSDFSHNSYDIIATMTDSHPANLYTYNIADTVFGRNCSNGDIGIMIIPDNLLFQGIQITVGAIAYTFIKLEPDSEEFIADCVKEDGNVLSKNVDSLGRNWPNCGLTKISKALKSNGICMSHSEDNYPSRKSFEAILPGTLLSAEKQCEAREWKQSFVCSKYTTCEELYCSMDIRHRTCYNFGPALDGTACSTGKICLDGKCVTDVTVPASRTHESENVHTDSSNSKRFSFFSLFSWLQPKN